ncbi:ATP-binding protein [Frigoribacterium sp. CFBP9039]|uniref:ATP-binding protein n=1 Tax=Frigoribacterium TaxID=96492 RepID=UPI0017801DE5|nr:MULTISPECIES: ATP-binding protein [Frigoribacterium]MBD8704024.1 ATP-binding protein [Frigoribacterium sp. CFBP 13712]MCJ0701933.1 ATP-binding protein [Frigoribacterium faeni]MDY0891476.1 ATP-binding protein [Frigoribacterium sp. CFBP9030]MDY0947084.1 ATP-binding protein [Frigoribacterium sp. CFBP9039]
MTESDGVSVIDVAAVPESIDLVQNTFEAWWTALGIDSMEVRFPFETAIVEIAANVIEHSIVADGAEGIEGRRFTLELRAEDERLTAVFNDNGLPAEIDLSDVSMADLDDEGGRGLALAMLSLESLDYTREGGRNIWTLVCRR